MSRSAKKGLPAGSKALLLLVDVVIVFAVAGAIAFYIVGSRERVDLPRRQLHDHIEYLSHEIGPRPAGSKELLRAFDYVKQELQKQGYSVQEQKVRLPDGGQTRNIWTDKPGKSNRIALFVAHLDTVKDCPGANDDGTGAAVLLEMARAFRHEQTPLTLRFAFFGAEEEIHGYRGHGFGSLHYVDSLPPAERSRIAYAFWLDKLGRGPNFKVLHIKGSKPEAAGLVQRFGRGQEAAIKLREVNRWSDRMAFEDAGIPTAWIEWGPDPELHKPSDTIGNLDWQKVMSVVTVIFRLATEGR